MKWEGNATYIDTTDDIHNIREIIDYKIIQQFHFPGMYFLLICMRKEGNFYLS